VSEHVHCWHGDMVQTICPPILVLRCCWCGQEQREFMHADLQHGPHAHHEALLAAPPDPERE